MVIGAIWQTRRYGTTAVPEMICIVTHVATPVARSPKVVQPVNPHRDVLRRRLAHGDAVSEARILWKLGLHRLATFKCSFESKASHVVYMI